MSNVHAVFHFDVLLHMSKFYDFRRCTQNSAYNMNITDILYRNENFLIVLLFTLYEDLMVFYFSCSALTTRALAVEQVLGLVKLCQLSHVCRLTLLDSVLWMLSCAPPGRGHAHRPTNRTACTIKFLIHRGSSLVS